jgi:serine/threonine protein kinase
MSLVAGSKLGPYEILALIGAGGMGEVYRALDTRLNRPVAVKLLSDELADAAARRRFQREAQMASSLNHPHILTLHDVGEIEDRQYLVTEYIDGGTLKDWSRPPGQRTWREIVELLVGVADGLGVAHAAGILHRDIKPANILITKSGYAKLADFGLAKLVGDPNPDEATWTLTDKRTRTGVVIGTVAYMSPEQAAGKPLDSRSDIFSFGVVLYQMLAGRRPFEGATDLETLQTIIHGTPQPLTEDVPVALRAVVEKALEKDSADRYQAMREMVVDLRRLTRQSADTVVPPARPVRRIRPAATVALMVLLAAPIALIVFQSRSHGPLDRTQYTQLTNFDSAIDPALSPDGRMMAFVRGTGPAVQSTGDPTEIYIKLLPDGDPVQLTHDGLPYKGSPRFSLDGARIAYFTLETTGFYTWVVPVLGGQGPRRFLTNAMGLNWINEGNQPRILFSYMTGKGVTMAVASSTESRSDQRTVYTEDSIMNHLSLSFAGREATPHERDGTLREMGGLPVGALRRKLETQEGWSPARTVCWRCLVPRWEVDVFHR